MLKIKGISKKFITISGEKIIFDGLDLNIGEGDFVTIIGSNGAGKSTLMNLIIGNLEPEAGSIIVDDTEITRMDAHKRARFISKVYQNPTFGTAPSMTIKENLAMAERKGKTFGLRFGLKKGSEPRYKEILSTLGLGLENQLDTPVGLLSGGQRQCLSLIMATMQRPKMLLLDEHTAALDPKTQIMIMEKTKEIVERDKLTTLMITHNLQDAIDYGNRLIMLHNKEVILDITGEEKKSLTIDKLLKVFHDKDKNAISETMLFQ
ncbi:MAG: ATP-binding cassette domain-containing protein [Fusobacteriaceae bacterium]|jgi:putative ABC transport system ATP-binding protein|nr:ATP-binding cassette domain-containing protein [Fusobacteriaceae bacterium]MBN2839178.1 ATP-binding cassette domain-containing protein [Fusobacteriaceae bacterium]